MYAYSDVLATSAVNKQMNYDKKTNTYVHKCTYVYVFKISHKYFHFGDTVQQTPPADKTPSHFFQLRPI